MYLPFGQPKLLQCHHSRKGVNINQVVAKRDKVLFAVVGDCFLSLWYCKPSVELVCQTRKSESVNSHGISEYAIWKADSSAIAVVTSKGFLLLYKVSVQRAAGSVCQVYNRQCSRASRSKLENFEASTNGLPAVRISVITIVELPGGICCLSNIKDELVAATYTGILKRINWDGLVNGSMSIPLNTIRFSLDTQDTEGCVLENGSDIYATDLQYYTMVHGLALVFSDGRAGFITSSTSKFQPTALQGVLAPDLTNACCVKINEKYRLIAFGCKSGHVIVYTIGDLSSHLQFSHRLCISSKDYPNAYRLIGPVTNIQWTQDYTTCAVSWKNGGFSVWSVFGSLVMCSLNVSTTSAAYPGLVKSMDWGPEGYHLWMACHPHQMKSTSNKPESDHMTMTSLLQYNFVKSAMINNACISSYEHVILISDDRLFINHKHNTPTTHNNTQSGVCSNGAIENTTTQTYISTLGNKQWQIIQIPSSYLATNWPIRYAAVDSQCQNVAVAGRFGIAHHHLGTKKWKLFGNTTQEKDMIVTGGLGWWQDSLVLTCWNSYEDRDEIRVYPRMCNLDNTFCTKHRIPAAVLLLNIFYDKLVMFCVDYHIMVFKLTLKDSIPYHQFTVIEELELSLADYIPHPLSVTSVALTYLKSETGSRHHHECSDTSWESLLINVAGRVVMFQNIAPCQDSDDSDEEVLSCPPIVLASCVENLWICPRISTSKQYLTDTLWLSCGALGMKVWLPLLPQGGEKHNFLARRIMLPLATEIYPLAVLFEDAVIVGASSDVVHHELSTAQKQQIEIKPFYTIERTTQVYLHQVLRQLLRRNLGFHALEMAKCCTLLPYFPHALELMIHEVLEEEATASEPIPDALLPRVIAFIQEFPEYLQTIVHCARKTEVALWHYLFSCVGNPLKLFQECLQRQQFNTAASYLIILQNLEPATVSRQHATLLLDTTLDNCCWPLSKDIVRFLRAIGPEDDEDYGLKTVIPPSTPILYPLASTPPSGKDGKMFVYPANNRMRNLSIVSTSHHTHCSESSKDTMYRRHSGGQALARSRSLSGDRRSGSDSQHSSAENYFIDLILNRHARKLLSSLRIKQLGMFAAHLEFDLTSWLRKERLRAGRVDNFVSTLTKMHSEFDWPLPCIPSSPQMSTLFKCLDPGSRSSSRELSGPDTESNSIVDSPCHESVFLSDSIDDMNISSSTTDVHQSSALFNRMLSEESMTSNTSCRTQDAYLRPLRGDDVGSVVSCDDLASAFGDSDLYSNDDISWYWSQAELEAVLKHVTYKGSKESDRQLRYMLQQFTDSGCLEWALILAVILLDLTEVTRVVNVASTSGAALETVGRMREGLSYLELWADTECQVYKPFLVACRPQMSVLSTIVETMATVQATPLSTSCEDSLNSADFNTLSLKYEGEVDISPDIDTPYSVPDSTLDYSDDDQYACVLS